MLLSPIRTRPHNVIHGGYTGNECGPKKHTHIAEVREVVVINILSFFSFLWFSGDTIATGLNTTVHRSTCTDECKHTVDVEFSLLSFKLFPLISTLFIAT